MMNAEILAVGTELLLGDIVNTNAQFLSKELAGLGIPVYFQSVVGDNADRLMESYRIAFERSDLLITSGGLGPTEDDLTKETAARYFDKKMIRSEETLKHLENLLVSQNYPMTENNRKQADIPEGAKILKNNNGTAPGIYLEENGKILILLPGPPQELIPMFKESVLPLLLKKQERLFHSRTIKVCGIGESALETKLKDLIDSQTNPTIATYASLHEVKLRLTASAKTQEEAEEMIKPVADEIYKRIASDIYGEDEDTLTSVLAKKLSEKKFKLAVAESCTGGKLSSTLVEHSGISEVLLESLVTYSNESKIQRLGVKAETLEKFGAVSEETAIEMAKGVAECLWADVAISTTGIAGPTGGTDEKPVGLVYIGLFIQGKVYCKKCNFKGSREKIRTRAVTSAIDFALRHL